MQSKSILLMTLFSVGCVADSNVGTGDAVAGFKKEDFEVTLPGSWNEYENGDPEMWTFQRTDGTAQLVISVMRAERAPSVSLGDWMRQVAEVRHSAELKMIPGVVLTKLVSREWNGGPCFEYSAEGGPKGRRRAVFAMVSLRNEVINVSLEWAQGTPFDASMSDQHVLDFLEPTHTHQGVFNAEALN